MAPDLSAQAGPTGLAGDSDTDAGSTAAVRPPDASGWTDLAADFPLLSRPAAGGRRLVYLDSAASSQKPAAVLAAMARYYENSHANVHRGVYRLAEEATEAYEAARARVATFICAPSPAGVVFTKNATEAVNLVAHSYGRHRLGPGKAVLLTEMEHHANLVPWLMLAAERGVEVRYIPIDNAGRLILDGLDRLLDGVGLVGLSAASNVLGTLNPVRRVADAAHAVGAVVLVDGAQWVPHAPTDVAAMGADFLVFSGHKMCGPTGIGVLWARSEILADMPAFLGGGEMIRDVRLDGWTPNDAPWRFEAGTPPIAEAVGLAAACDYLDEVGLDRVRAHSRELVRLAMEQLADRHPQMTVLGPPADEDRCGVMAFTYGDVHPHDLSQVLDSQGVCIRAGHHCAKPLMRRLGLGAAARASFYLYNQVGDVDALDQALTESASIFAGAA